LNHNAGKERSPYIEGAADDVSPLTNFSNRSKSTKPRR